MAEGDLLDVDVVAADRRVWSGKALSITAKTVEGDIGILPNHEPFLAVLAPSAVEILTADSKREVIAVDSGFVSVADNRVSVLSQFGRLAHEVSVAEAEKELREAESALEQGDTDLEIQQHHDRATAQLAAARKAQR